MTSTRTTPSNTIAPPNHFATQSMFFCDEANRVSHFMSKPTRQMSMALPVASQEIEPVP